MEFLAETIESVSVVLERYENDLFTLLCKPNTYTILVPNNEIHNGSFGSFFRWVRRDMGHMT